MNPHLNQTPALELPPSSQSWKIGIVCADFHGDITAAQLSSATDYLEAHGVAFDVIHVPGSFELIYGLDTLAQTGRYQGLIAIGCLIKGETIHFEVIAQTVGDSVARLIQAYHLPIGFGVITANTVDQAQTRVSLGADAARATLASLSVAMTLQGRE